MALDLLKKSVKIVLEKRGVPDNVMAQVGVAFDITGSMKGLYSNGTVQALAERLLAVALRFDDNGNLDAWSFCEESDELPGITEANFATYVDKSMINNNGITKWNGTNYAPVLREIEGFYFGGTKKVTKTVETKASGFGGFFGKKNVETVVETTKVAGQNDGSMPVYLMFITDGANYDEAKTWAVLESLKDQNIYIEFIGIGNEQFKFCREAGDRYGNVGFVHIKNLATTSDDDLYNALLNEEFCEWIKK